jgi:hypothetical protein
MALLFVWLESELVAGRDCIIDANFENERDTPLFVALSHKYMVQWVQLHVVCDGAVLWQRHLHRGASGTRHPGHLEHAVAGELEQRLRRGRAEPLHIDAPCIELDTTNVHAIDMVQVHAQIQHAFIAHPSA